MAPKKHFRPGGQPVLGRIPKRGHVSWRPRLSPGARSLVQGIAHRTDAKRVGVEGVRPRRGDTSAAGAFAAQHARMHWALWAGDPA